MAWSARTKPTTETVSTRNEPIGADEFLLKEDEDFLLLENGDKIVLSYASQWSLRTRPS